MHQERATATATGKQPEVQGDGEKIVSKVNSVASSSGTKDEIVPPHAPVDSDAHMASVVKEFVEAVDVSLDHSKVIDLDKGDTAMKHRNCYRCGTRGHATAQCTVELLCELCDSTEHGTLRCPLQREPKPVAQSVGFCLDALGAYYIEHPHIQPTKRNTRTALVVVEGEF
ncbi:hypothetical protein ACP70R_022821 [Stipagrostis hirtigluma subsp. patula]